MVAFDQADGDRRGLDAFDRGESEFGGIFRFGGGETFPKRAVAAVRGKAGDDQIAEAGKAQRGFAVGAESF